MQVWQQKMQQLNQWWQTDIGKILFQQEKQIASEYLFNLLGHQLVLIASDLFVDLVNNRRMHHCLRIDPLTENFAYLPEKIDAIIVPHLLAFHPNAEIWLQSFHDKLSVDGKLILTGYHYMSCLGLQRLFFSRAISNIPSVNNSCYKLRSLLLKTQFLIEHNDKFSFGWVAKKCDQIHKKNYFGNIYYLVASKKLVTVKSFNRAWKYDRYNAAKTVLNSFEQGS